MLPKGVNPAFPGCPYRIQAVNRERAGKEQKPVMRSPRATAVMRGLGQTNGWSG